MDGGIGTRRTGRARGAVSLNFGGQGLTTFTVRGFTTGEFYRNGFPINRGYPNMPDANTIVVSSVACQVITGVTP